MSETQWRNPVGGNPAARETGAEASASPLARREPLSVELNLAKFAAFLFAPSHTRQDVRPRAKNWVTEAAGTKVLARIIVHTVDHETLNTLDHRTTLALQKLWWATPVVSVDGSRQFAIRDLARTMRLTWGKKTFLLLKGSLRRLRRTPITWSYAFFDHASKRLISTEEPLTILALPERSEKVPPRCRPGA